MDNMNYFLDIYGGVKRAGPGSHECTRRAFELMSDLPSAPRILDIGCGPGVQTVDLLNLCAGQVIALDFLSQMLERTLANAREAKLSERLEVLAQDMNQMNFAPASFDIVWSEGAIYNMGFEHGLRKIKEFVKPGGYVAVSEAVWLQADPPKPVVDFWQEYPEIDSVENKLEVIKRLGYQSVGHFVLPIIAWTEDYYHPMEVVIAQKEKEWAGNSEAIAVIQAAKHEIELFRRYSDYYSYAFFVMQLPSH